MNFSINNDKAYITGDTGTYSGKVADSNVVYGRNSVANYKQYLNALTQDSFESSKQLQTMLEKLKNIFKSKVDISGQLDKIQSKLEELAKRIPIPINFVQKYLPGQVDAKNLNTQALMGAAYEDLGKKEVSVSELDKEFKYAGVNNATVAAFDINNDGKIDESENAVALLIKDMGDAHSTEEVLKTGKMNLDAKDLDGTITNVGEVNLHSFLNPKQIEQSKVIIKAIYDAFKLGKAKEDFENNPNNTLSV